jgi:hypothetical protein
MAPRGGSERLKLVATAILGLDSLVILVYTATTVALYGWGSAIGGPGVAVFALGNDPTFAPKLAESQARRLGGDRQTTHLRSLTLLSGRRATIAGGASGRVGTPDA